VRADLPPLRVAYTNYRGETAVRAILPKSVWFGSTEWHPEPQWFLTAYDVDKGADRDFALKDLGVPLEAYRAGVIHGQRIGHAWGADNRSVEEGFAEFMAAQGKGDGQ
jgi:hypothetical protein